MNACGVRDGLAGDMLVSSQRNLVLFCSASPLWPSKISTMIFTLKKYSVCVSLHFVGRLQQP